MQKNNKYKLVLGLEIHLHVKTNTKMFCGCSADIYDSKPNTHTCPVCLGLPGALPVPNKEAIRKVQLLGLALNCELNSHTNFDRKHYFYPDLSKGYQISQYKDPFCVGGSITLANGKICDLERIHLEEDTAKSFHEGENTLIDFNMGGMPLIEIVTKPIFTSASDAGEFSRKLRDLVRYLGISDADMEKGQLRIEPNISVRTVEMEEQNVLPKYKVEVKNINSFKYMERAVDFEFKRQADLLEKGETPIQENRGWNESKNITVSQRAKEEANDYRYFPEPDIPPMIFDETYIKSLSKELPELPDEIRSRYIKKYELTPNNAEMLTTAPGIEFLQYFEGIVGAISLSPNKIANLILNKEDFRKLSPEVFEQKLQELESKVEDAGELEAHILLAINENPDAVEKFKSGNENILQFFLGQVMRKTKGMADPQVTLKLLREHLTRE